MLHIRDIPVDMKCLFSLLCVSMEYERENLLDLYLQISHLERESNETKTVMYISTGM